MSNLFEYVMVSGGRRRMKSAGYPVPVVLLCHDVFLLIHLRFLGTTLAVPPTSGNGRGLHPLLEGAGRPPQRGEQLQVSSSADRPRCDAQAWHSETSQLLPQLQLSPMTRGPDAQATTVQLASRIMTR